MTKLGVINANRAAYTEVQNAMNSMNTLEKSVAEYITLVWLKGNKWHGGLSDAQYDKAIVTINQSTGASFDAIMAEADRQMAIFG